MAIETVLTSGACRAKRAKNIIYIPIKTFSSFHCGRPPPSTSKTIEPSCTLVLPTKHIQQRPNPPSFLFLLSANELSHFLRCIQRDYYPAAAVPKDSGASKLLCCAFTSLQRTRPRPSLYIVDPSTLHSIGVLITLPRPTPSCFFCKPTPLLHLHLYDTLHPVPSPTHPSRPAICK